MNTEPTNAADRGSACNDGLGLVERLRERGTDCDWNGVDGGAQGLVAKRG